MQPDDVKSISNAIWVCADHAKLIDENRGVRYPPALLISYKGLHEAKIAREQRGIHAPIAWFQQLTVNDSALFKAKTTLQFGQVTLITGNNGLGKTALCELLAGFGNPSALERWMPTPHNQSRLDVEVLCYMPEEQIVRLTIGAGGLIEVGINGKEYPTQMLPLRFVFLQEKRVLRKAGNVDDVEIIAERLNIDPLALPNLFRFVDKYGLGWARNLRITEEPSDNGETSRSLRGDVRGTKPGLWFPVLSGTEQTFVLIELALSLARFSAQLVPTMLLLDGGIWHFETNLLAELATHLSSPAYPFQTVIVMANEPKGLANLRWAGWQVAKLEQGGDGTTIAQESHDNVIT